MKHKLLLTIFTVCLLASLILAFIPAEDACGSNNNELNGCQIVEESPYSKTIGVSNSYFGIIAFLTLTILTLSQIKHPKKHKEKFIHIGVTICAIIAIYFLYLQFFIIKAFCTYCMIVDIGSVISLILIFFYIRKNT